MHKKAAGCSEDFQTNISRFLLSCYRPTMASQFQVFNLFSRQTFKSFQMSSKTKCSPIVSGRNYNGKTKNRLFYSFAGGFPPPTISSIANILNKIGSYFISTFSASSPIIKRNIKLPSLSFSMKKSLHAPPPLDLILDSETNQLHYEDPTQSHVWPIIEEFQAYLKQKGETIIQNSNFCALFVQGVGSG